VISRLPQWILFDLDGTLLDSLPGIESSVRAAFTTCRMPQLHTNLREMIGPPIRVILSRAGAIENQESLDCLERAFREDYDTRGWRKTLCFPDAGPVLRLMREHGFQLLAITNKPRHISLRILENERILELFEEIVTRDSRSPAYSDKEEMIRTIQAERHISPTNCLMVGDTIEDAKAAASAGIRFAFMSHGYGTVDETTSIPIEWKLDGLSEFISLLEINHD
jgi:phosphoglycolate phosphatase